MKKQDLILNGSTKKLYKTEKDDQITIEFLDEVADSSLKRKKISGKGEANNQISFQLLEYLESYYIPTHNIKKISKNEALVKKLEMIPFQITVWNYTTDKLHKRLGFSKNSQIEFPITELYLKKPPGTDLMINEFHAYALKYTVPEEMRSIYRVSSKINALLKSYLNRRKIQLIGFSLEFGRLNDKIVLGDEISLNTCFLRDEENKTLWDVKRIDALGKEAEKTYKQIVGRIFLDGK